MAKYFVIGIFVISYEHVFCKWYFKLLLELPAKIESSNWHFKYLAKMYLVIGISNI